MPIIYRVQSGCPLKQLVHFLVCFLLAEILNICTAQKYYFQYRDKGQNDIGSGYDLLNGIQQSVYYTQLPMKQYLPPVLGSPLK